MTSKKLCDRVQVRVLIRSIWDLRRFVRAIVPIIWVSRKFHIGPASNSLGERLGKLGNALGKLESPRAGWGTLGFSQAFPYRGDLRMMTTWGYLGFALIFPTAGGWGNSGNPRKSFCWGMLGISRAFQMAPLSC